jgi:hypothetical protein
MSVVARSLAWNELNFLMQGGSTTLGTNLEHMHRLFSVCRQSFKDQGSKWHVNMGIDRQYSSS